MGIMNVVQKYGGTCLDTIEKIQAVAQHIVDNKKPGDGIVIVASAMGKTTDELIALAKKVSDDVPKRELDALLATGEQQTVALLAIALQKLGINAVSMTGFQSGFVTTDLHTKARIKEMNTERVEQLIEAGKVPVVAGFQGISESGDITTLGRGGSDLTAVAIAAHLAWDCEIYTDVASLHTTDPKVYPQAKQLHNITYEEMMEMSSLGAGVMETRSVELAKKYDVKLFLGRALENDKSKGTYIMSNNNLLVEDMPITGISFQDDCTIFNIKKIKNDGKTVADLFNLLGELNVNVDMISQQITGANECSVSFSCTISQGNELSAAIETNSVLSQLTIEKQDGLAMISLVGVGMATHSGVASKVFSILATEQIPYYQITTSEISISVTVDLEKKVKAVIALCEAFGL